MGALFFCRPYNKKESLTLSLLSADGGTVLLGRIKRVCVQKLPFCPALSAPSRCLGFAPRSESFAFEPSVQPAQFPRYPDWVRQSLTRRPSANPLNQNCSAGGSTSSCRQRNKKESLTLSLLSADGGT